MPLVETAQAEAPSVEMSHVASSDDAASSTRAHKGPPPSTHTSQRRQVASLEHDKIEWAFGWILTEVTSDQCPAKIRGGRVDR